MTHQDYSFVLKVQDEVLSIYISCQKNKNKNKPARLFEAAQPKLAEDNEEHK